MLARAGILRPLKPSVALRAGALVHQCGASPATVVGLSALRWPHRTAVIDDAGAVTYGAIQRQTDALAARLLSVHGVGSGSSVALMCRNHRGLVIGLLAAARLGADVLLVNTELPASQLATTLDRHSPTVAIHDDEFDERLAHAAPEVARVSVWSDGEPVEYFDVADLGRIRTAGQLVLLTSGTTGAPKGVPRHLHPSAPLGMVASALHRLDLRTGQTMLVAPPAFHGMGILTLFLGLSAGNTVVLQRRFDADRAIEAIERHQVQTLVAVPTMLQRLLAVPDLRDRATSVRTILSGAAALSPVVASELMDVLGDVLYDGYGSSEVGIVTLATPADLREAPGTLGRPTLGTSIKILDKDGAPLPVGAIGEVCISSPMTFDGYTDGEIKHSRDGYMASGDLGHLDAAGRLFIDGRADDMIVSGGENVFPQPVEDALLSHFAVRDAAVVGVPDPQFGQRLRAFIVLHDGPYDEDGLRAHLRTRLTRYEQPRDLVVLDELPRNATGKILRKQLASMDVNR
jgi:fatty-acyl-CoA synthase